MILGTQTKNQLLKEPYSEWYVKEHDEYAIDQNAVAELKKEKLNSYAMTIVLGTWCDDSHREVPRLMKILEELKYPEQKLTIIAVNRKKNRQVVKRCFQYSEGSYDYRSEIWQRNW